MALANLLKHLGLVKSTSEARRLIAAGAVKMDGQRVEDPDLRPFSLDTLGQESGFLLFQVGKRGFAQVTLRPLPRKLK